MKRTLLHLVLALFVATTGSAASLFAAEGEGDNAGGYIAIGAGAAFVSDSDITQRGTELGYSYRLKMKGKVNPGFSLYGAVGYDFGPVRIEGELSWRRAGLDSLTSESLTIESVASVDLGNNEVSLKGDVSSLGLVVNAWYDIDTGTKWVPYFGGGLGTARIALGVEEDRDGSLLIDASDYSDWVFAYQVGAGVGYAISDNWMLQIGYRYFATTAPEFTDDDFTIKSEFNTHNVGLGLRFRF